MASFQVQSFTVKQHAQSRCSLWLWIHANECCMDERVTSALCDGLLWTSHLLCVFAVGKLLIMQTFCSVFLTVRILCSSSVTNISGAEPILLSSERTTLCFSCFFHSGVLGFFHLPGCHHSLTFRTVCHLLCVSLCCWHLLVFLFRSHHHFIHVFCWH